MKTKHILFALAAPLFVAACTNEELVETSTVQNLGETISTESFTLKGGFADAQSRMAFDGVKLKWQLGKSGAKTDELGLCLALDGKAQTNYKYVVSILEAESGNTYKVNGGNFEPVTVQVGDNDVEISGNNAYAYYVNKFVTENATIFTGKYIAYYPYDTNFKEASATIPVSVEAIQEAPSGFNDYKYVGDYAFYVSKPFQIQGGDQEADFEMNQVLPILRFDLKNTGSSALTVSKIQVSAEGGMPVSAGVNANLTGAVALSDITVDAEKNVESQLLILDANNTVGTSDSDKEKKAYMVVMPGTYKNLKVKVILNNGAYMERTIESLSLGLTTLQPITLELNSQDMTKGDIYGQVTSAAELKAALEAAAAETVGTVNINVIKPISDTYANIFETTSGASNVPVTINGEKITVTGAATPSQALKNVTINNEVEFQNTYATNGNDNVTFAGKTTFKNTVTVTDGSVLNIAGNATAENTVTVGTAANAATLNIQKEGTLNMNATTLSAANQAAAHAINVLGTLNLNNKADGSAGATLEGQQTNNVIKISGTVNVSSKSSVVMTNGKWYVGNGTINNDGTLTPKAPEALGEKEVAMTLNNNGSICVTYLLKDWNSDKVNIVNKGTYTVVVTSVANMEEFITDKESKYGYVTDFQFDITSSPTLALTDACLDMSKYNVTFNVNASTARTVTITIPASKEWKVGTLNANFTDVTSQGTITIKSAGTTAVASSNVTIDELNVVGADATSYGNALVKFDKNYAAIVMGTISNLYVENAKVESNTDNKVTCSSDPKVKGTTSISLN